MKPERTELVDQWIKNNCATSDFLPPIIQQVLSYILKLETHIKQLEKQHANEEKKLQTRIQNAESAG